jgi:membrane-bound lytic murein transglycosylase B
MQNYKKISLLFLSFAYLSCTFYPTIISAQSASSTAVIQAQLQQQLQQVENQIQQYQSQLSQTTAQKNTLANKIKSLENQEAVLNLQIQASNLQINQLTGQISQTQATITQNTADVQNLQNQISGVIDAINQNDNYPLVYTVISQQDLSDAFTAYENYAQISKGLGTLVNQLNVADSQLQQQSQQLTSQQQDAQNLVSISILQQSQLADTVNQQNTLLQETKGKEASYQEVITVSKQQAAAIQSQIYQLLGVNNQITFGQALQIAQWAAGVTGIDPAFLLAILTQESNLGKNVGTCNRAGDPPSKSYKVVMNPTRDIPPFLQVTQDLGLDPNVTPVSCPMHASNGSQIGWGGAMGPAQFIPSTWAGYADKVAKATGQAVANPWDIRDAFAAAAIKLSADGANGTYQGDWDAAMRYFSGSTNPRYRFYGDNVMATTAKYQTDISSLGK